MKLKNIESIEELKVGDEIYAKGFNYTVLAKCEGAVMIDKNNSWLTLKDIKLTPYQIEDKSSEWVPKEGENVWTTNFLEASGVEEIRYSPHLWAPVVLLKRGLIFRTEEEARDCAKKMLEAIKK